MTRWMLITALALAACSKGGSGSDALKSRWTTWRDQMCACKDKACTEKLFEEWRTWATNSNQADAPKLSREEVDAVGKLQDEFHACGDKIKATGP